jgi:hypothetical protein
MTDALKTCPFCGEPPQSLPSGDGTGLMIGCMTLKCVNPHVSYYPPSAAISAWNRRAGLPVRVKPLVWHPADTDVWRARPENSRKFYDVTRGRDGIRVWFGADVIAYPCGSVELAKAAAQADHDARIRAALEE